MYQGVQSLSSLQLQRQARPTPLVIGRPPVIRSPISWSRDRQQPLQHYHLQVEGCRLQFCVLVNMWIDFCSFLLPFIFIFIFLESVSWDLCLAYVCPRMFLSLLYQCLFPLLPCFPYSPVRYQSCVFRWPLIKLRPCISSFSCTGWNPQK